MRKYLFILFTCVLFINFTSAQVDSSPKQAFKFEIGLGTTVQSAKFNGLLMYFEPSYSFAGRLKAGVRFEQAFLSMKNIGSSILTFDYYVVNHPGFRVFAGSGPGYYSTSSSGGCDPGPTTTQITRSTKNFGGMVRAGIEIKHFRFGVEYNFVPSTYVTAVGDDGQAGSTVIYKNGYLGIEASILIGGGKRKSTAHPAR